MDRVKIDNENGRKDMKVCNKRKIRRKKDEETVNTGQKTSLEDIDGA